MDEKRELLRHTLATVAYRAARCLVGAPDDFADFDGAGREPARILAHMGDLFDWALSAVRGNERWHNSTPLPWNAEKERFFSTLQAFEWLPCFRQAIARWCRVAISRANRRRANACRPTCDAAPTSALSHSR
jgi:hypothetical protein